MRDVKRIPAALIVTALVAAGCAPATAGPARRAAVVPWLNRKAPAYVPPSPALRAAYRRCLASQLSGRPGRSGPAAGTVYTQVVLTNHSDRPCTLAGSPAAVTGSLPGGGTVTLAGAARHVTGLGGPGPANLRPGESGLLTLAYGDGCTAITSGGKALYRALFLAVRGGRVLVRFPSDLNLVCGLAVGQFAAEPGPPPGSRSALNVLTVTAALPARLRAGATVGYTVTLRNRGRVPVRLMPCPSYTEYLGVFSPAARHSHVTRRYYLNCGAVRQIPARGSVTFAMRLPVPGEYGQAKFDWQFQDAEVATAVVVTIGG
jgi:hypothetical protein